MSLAAMKQALAALENSQSYVEFDWVKNQCGRAITALRAAIEQAHGDWDEVEALRASLREHMAEIHRLRQWQGLTDDEIDRVTDQQWATNNNKPIYAAHKAYARAIEAKLKEKNNAR